MELDEDNNEFKICGEDSGHCDRSEEGVKWPFEGHQVKGESNRSCVRQCNNSLIARSRSPRMCWCADTPDRAFLIGRHLNYISLVLAVGRSGHGCGDIPAIGRFILHAMEDKLEPWMRDTLRWGSETATNRHRQDLQGKLGPDGIHKVDDLRILNDWTKL